ncbi:MAG: hypothetical protein ABH884_00525 [Candidatus Komeilibacteria bacterium]
MKKRRLIIFFVVLLFIIGWSILVYQIGPEQLVERIGVHNGYLLAFLVTLFGGSSTFTSLAYVTTISTLAFGGLSPFILALVGGIGLFLGDSVYVFLGYHGSQALADSKYVNYLANWMNKLPHWSVGIVTYLYFSSLLPNDVILILFGLGKYSYKKLMVPLLLGDITFIFIVAYLASLGIKLFN